MFNKLAKLIKGADKYSHFGATIDLPLEGMAKTALSCYGNDRTQKTIPVSIVVIYNVEQLASEIAKHLKDGTSDGGERDNDN